MARTPKLVAATVHLAALGTAALLRPRLEGLLLVVLGCVFFAAEVWAQGKGRDEHGDAASLVSGIGLLGIFVVGLVFGRSVGLHSFVAGALLFLLGILLRVLALRTLGPWFVSGARLQPGQILVTSGIYRLLRHPSESGLLAIGAGAIVLVGSAAAAVLLLLVLLPSCLVRVCREEALLRRAFGDEHRSWARRVGALLP